MSVNKRQIKKDRGRSRRSRDGRPTPEPRPSRVLSDCETRARLEPHCTAIGLAYCEALDRGVIGPFVLVARPRRGDPFRVLGLSTASAGPALEGLVRLAPRGAGRVVVLADAGDLGVACFSTTGAADVATDDLVRVVFDRWRAGLRARYDAALDPVVYVRVSDVTDVVSFGVEERLTLLAAISAQGAGPVELARRPAAPGCVAVWVHRPNPWRLEALDVPRALLDGPAPW